MAGVLANFVCLSKLNCYLLLTKDIITVLWKKENGGAVSLLIIFYAMTLYRNMCTYMCALYVKVHS